MAIHIRFLLCFIGILWFVPSVLSSQTKITYRPQFDSAANHRNHLYSFKTQKRPRIGLVLSGGGARGAAQIGVLKALERNNIPVDFISATSMGAIVGGLYASGYTSADIESLALSTNWDEVLSFSDETKRTDLPIDRKIAGDWSFLAVRFQGLRPVIPHAVSSGQRLTNFLSEQTLQALYHPNPTFDNLKIPFRAVTTDLISGSRIILDRGSFAEALRASSTVPLLFSPVDKDSMQLVDGGLVTNIPVDVAREAGCDVVVAVNSTSGLRNAIELKAPWQTADQIMGIMMQLANQEQIKQADVAITPSVGRHLSSDFTGLEALIDEGYRSAEQQIDSIKALYQRAVDKMDSAETDGENRIFEDVQLEIVGEGAPDSLLFKLRHDAFKGTLSSIQIRKHIRALFATGNFQDIVVEVFPESRPTQIVFTLYPNPLLSSVRFTGNTLVSSDSLEDEFRSVLGKILNQRRCSEALESLLKLYRNRGYSLARVVHSSFDETTGTMHIELNEGVIEYIHVRGGVRTEESFVFREFPLAPGDVFEIDKAKQGLTNLIGTRVFEHVYLEISYEDKTPGLTIRLAELPSQLIRFGIRSDDERKLQGTIDIRDENFRGIGTDLGFTLSGGDRNGRANLEFKSNSLLSRSFTFNLGLFVGFHNSYVYADDPKFSGTSRWERDRTGEYSDIRLGGRLVVGAQLQRLGSVTAEWSLQRARIRNLDNAPELESRYTLSLFKIGTMVDGRDDYPFPTSGQQLVLSYEFASTNLLSDVGYNAIRFMYASYRSWGERSVFCPRITVGIADLTMPLGQQFFLGGRESMFGTREDDRRGRQLVALNLEYRYKLPIDFVFDSYLRVRYDLASISATPQQIKLSSFRHGVGLEFALDTPLGQAALGAGKSFFFDGEVPARPFRHGPLLFYFVLGYEL